VAPTTFYDADRDQLESLGVRLFICANHNIRATVAAMVATCAQIQRGGLTAVEPVVAPLSSIFEMLNYAELSAAEEIYLSAGGPAGGHS
jgi:phosphoenolpyruvate phosphomutase